MKNMLANLYSALFGGGVFGVTYFVLQIGLFPALIFTVAGYAAAVLLIFPTKQQETAAASAASLRAVLKEGELQLKQMRALAAKISNQHVRLTIEDMGRIGFNIFEVARKKPQNLRATQQFSAYYLTTTLKMIATYLELSGRKAASPEIQTTMEKVETTLEQAKLAFAKQLENLVQDDMLDLDTDITVFQEMMELEK